MAERPILLFGDAVSAERQNKSGGSGKIQIPSHASQARRLAPKLTALNQTLLSMQNSPMGIEAEMTLVFEVNGNIANFYTAIKNMGDEAEWIFDIPKEFDASEDFYAYKEDKDTKERIRRDDKNTLGGKVYCVLTNAKALKEILNLWEEYGKNESMKFPSGKTGLRDVFKNLIDIHLWGYKERLEETGVIEIWRDELMNHDVSNVKCEIELFYRTSSEKRETLERSIIDEIKNNGGNFITKTVIPEIKYHAILASIPRNVVERILNGGRDISILVSNPIMFIRPVGQSAYIQKDNSFDAGFTPPSSPIMINEPIVALFDGLPQENHPFLTGRLEIDDPSDYTSQYTVQARRHGTSMASLVAFGDLGNIVHQSIRKIYVRPIMKPRQTPDNDTIEEIPDDTLLVDTIYTAVRRLFEETAGRVAPTIKVINFSIGISYRHFDRAMSPLARLLDWLSFKYRVLFVVSAGNHSGNNRYKDVENINIGMALSDFAKLSMPERDKIIIEHLHNNSRHLRLLSPAESMNALTVGATFEDNTNFTETERLILPCSNGMLNPISSLGKGLNNAIKPDIVYDGGRKFVTTQIIGATDIIWPNVSTKEPGIISAAPMDVAIGSNKTMYTMGTSNSAALISHEAGHCYDTLLDVFQSAERDIPQEHIALLLKAMLVHGAEWGKLGEKFCDAIGWEKRAHSDELHRFIGYGKPDINRAIECAKNRVTLIGYGNLKGNEARLYTLPLPFDFSSKELCRRLTATLTYFSPIVPPRQKYRAADVWYKIETAPPKLVATRIDANDKAVTRGSVQHEIFENEESVVWDENGTIQIKVNCRPDANDTLDDEIPYALMVSFEIKNDIDIDVYTRVAERVQQRITV